MPEAKTEKDIQRSLRIRDTKRRQRARQKEYTAELEQRLRSFEAQGVQATAEVQASARRVVRENDRLRKLLRKIGVEEEVINRWNQGQEVDFRVVNSCASDAGGVSDAGVAGTPGKRGKCSKGGGFRSDIPTREPSQAEEQPESTPTPCKLVRALAENPHTDIAQLPSSISAPTDADSNTQTTFDKMPCSKAAQMLLRFATSDDKLQTLAGILERGCAQDGKGGCNVENKVMLEALDGVCM